MIEKQLDTSLRGDSIAALASDLKSLVIGQDSAVDQLVDVYQLQSLGLQAPNRPLASFLFVGPTGTGKTCLVESLAKLLHGDRRCVLKIDCAEYQHAHEVARLIGAPPGYLGHKETKAALSQMELEKFTSAKNPISIVLFDEIEKASDTFWRLLLGVLDKGTLTLGDNGKVDFSRALICMTSNLGAKEITSILGGSGGLGFSPATESLEVATSNRGIAAARKHFTPEFMNRIDRVIPFRALSAEDLRRILDLELNYMQQRVILAAASGRAPKFLISLTESAKTHLTERGLDIKYGARELKRVLESTLMYPILNLLSSHQIGEGDVLNVTVAEGKLQFYKVGAV